MMKRCQECNFQNEALIDSCWQCGSRSIVWANVPQSMQATQMFRSETPTYYRAASQNNNTNYDQNNQTNSYSYATNNVPTPRSSGSNKIILAIAGIFTFLLLFSAVGAATYYQVVIKRPVVKLTEQAKVEVPVKESEPVKEDEKVKETVKKTETVKNAKTNGIASTTKKSNNDTESAELERMWVDYNVKENGRLGMRIHVNFTAYNMKDVRSYLGIYFEKQNGIRLTTKDKKFASSDGQVAIYYFITPAYDQAVYEDVKIFMPYDELNLGRGKFDLTMSADVIYEKGGLIEHLKDYDFIYEEK